MCWSGEISGWERERTRLSFSFHELKEKNLSSSVTLDLFPSLISCCWSSCWCEQYLLDSPVANYTHIHKSVCAITGDLQRVDHFILQLCTWSLSWLNGEMNPHRLLLLSMCCLCVIRDINTFQEIWHSSTLHWDILAEVLLNFFGSCVTSCTFSVGDVWTR